MSGSKSMFRNLISKLTYQTIFVDKLTYIHTYIRAENYVKVCNIFVVHYQPRYEIMSGSKSMFRNLISKLTYQTIFVDKLTYIQTYIRAENYVKVCKRNIFSLHFSYII